MSSFVYENYVEEFAYRTKLNYYNLMIGQVTEALKTATKKEDDNAIKDCKEKILDYQEKINTLTSEMRLLGYPVSHFYEVTQLINSLVGLLIFPKQVYDGLLDRDQNEANLEKDLPTVWRIISNDTAFAFTYKEFQKKAEGIEEYAKNRATVNEIDSLLSRELDGEKRKELNRQKNQLNLAKREIETQLFINLPVKALSTYTIIQHMRNAVAHKHLSVFPEEKDQRIEAIIIKDVGEGKIKCSKNGMPCDLSYEYRERENGNDPRYGVFQLRIGVDDLEKVLIEMCNLILEIAKKANEK